MSQDQFSEIASLIQQARNSALKAVNTELVNLYWQVGEHISRRIASSNWGEKTVDELAAYLKRNHPELKGFGRRGLYRMKQFYETYTASSLAPATASAQQSLPIVSSPMTQLEASSVRGSILAKVSWTHHLVLLSRARTAEEREFYLRLCIQEKYSVKQLERQISSGVFERVMLGNQSQPPAIKGLDQDVVNVFKDSYVFEFLNLSEPHSEGALQKALLAQMRRFILELGRDFLFVGEEYRLQVGNSDFFVDLLFYHRGLQCLVAFELKADKFRPEHLGQLNFYLEALDRDVRKANENPSIGILLCKDRDTEVVEYALSRNLSPALVAEYKTQLPDKELLQQKLHALFGTNQGNEH
ncbi:PDDEXK nuclease domain-containing protein [Pontibacter chitinilyticus]|uniref:PDDEXK nuclease domain-containing protein n=1 Tax=Pontibacter chitinilyticus TaxID=2674989 RepID=UPI003219EF7D